MPAGCDEGSTKHGIDMPIDVRRSEVAAIDGELATLVRRSGDASNASSTLCKKNRFVIKLF
jgi:hypothetical protein